MSAMPIPFPRQISPAAEPVPAPTPSPSAEFNLSKLPKKLRDLVLQRERIVQAWLAFTKQNPRSNADHLFTRFLVEIAAREDFTFSRSSLYNWRRGYLNAGREGLLDARSLRHGAPSEYLDFYRELADWWKNGNEPNATTCYKIVQAMARRNGWAVPSPRSASRYLARLHKPSIIRARQGKKNFDDICGAHVMRDYTRISIRGVERAMQANDIWCGDDHPCDCFVSYQGQIVRPFLTAWEDVRSRRIMAFRFWPASPDSSNHLLTLRTGIMANDLVIPRFFYVDNGKTFDNYLIQGLTKIQRRKQKFQRDPDLFRGVAGSLGIEVMHALPFNAKGKPVERFFGTFEGEFGKLQPTYCGKDTLSKPEGLLERIKGGVAPTFEEYVEQASAWITRIYHTNIHTGHAMGDTPDNVYAANLVEKRTTSLGALNICLQKTSKPVTVGRGSGVRWGERVYGMGDAALTPHYGQKVQLRVDPDDITRATVWTLDGKLLAEVRETQLAPWGVFSDQEAKNANLKVRRHNRAMQEAKKHNLRQNLDPVELMLEDRAEKLEAAAPAPPPESPALKLVRTPLEDQVNRLREVQSRRAIQPRRQAVGAEFDLAAFSDDAPSHNAIKVPSLLQLVGEE